MNTGIFAGSLGRDATLRTTPTDKSVLQISLAVNVGYGDKKETLWVDCSLWGERATKLERYLTKGTRVAVAGDVGLSAFKKKDGSQGCAITCNIQRITLLGGGEQQAHGPVEKPKPQREPQRALTEAELNDDIPFSQVAA